MTPTHTIEYYDKDGKFRAHYIAGLKEIAGCVRFVKLSPTGDSLGKGQVSKDKVKLKELATRPHKL